MGLYCEDLLVTPIIPTRYVTPGRLLKELERYKVMAEKAMDILQSIRADESVSRFNIWVDAIEGLADEVIEMVNYVKDFFADTHEKSVAMTADLHVDSERWDVFISHASEDKELFVKPLAEILCGFGLKVWYDEMELKIGDSLSQSINKGLVNSNYGVVVLSPDFYLKGGQITSCNRSCLWKCPPASEFFRSGIM